MRCRIDNAPDIVCRNRRCRWCFTIYGSPRQVRRDVERQGVFSWYLFIGPSGGEQNQARPGLSRPLRNREFNPADFDSPLRRDVPTSHQAGNAATWMDARRLVALSPKYCMGEPGRPILDYFGLEMISLEVGNHWC